MKRRILYGAAFLLLVVGAPSCEGISDCKVCRMVTTDSSNGQVTYGFDTEYCGAALLAIQAKGPVTVGTKTTEYECR
jgi:hypothetical protein